MTLTTRTRSGSRSAAAIAFALTLSVLAGGVPCVGGEPSRPDDASGDPQDPAADSADERVEVRGELGRPEDIAAFATTIRGDQVDRRGQDLADLLRRVPGARVRDYGGLGSYATMSLRASTSEQVTVLVDGVRQNRALGGPVDLSSIPATQIDEVTVYRGFGPAGLDIGGIGGLVDIRTRAPGETPEARVDLLMGQQSTARVSGGVSFATGETSWIRAGGEWLTSDGDFVYLDTRATPFNPDDDVERRRLNNDVEHGSATVQFVGERFGGGNIRVGLRTLKRERGVAGVDSFPSETARLDENQTDLTATWRRGFASFLQALDLQFDGFDQQIRFTDLEGDIGLAAQDQTTALDGAGVAAVLRARQGVHGLTMRTELRHERARVHDRALEAQDRGGASRDRVSITAEDVIVLGGVTVAPSLGWQYRSDDFREGEPGTVPAPANDISESAWTGKVGVAWSFAPSWSLRGTVGTSFRSPNLLELFGDRGSLVGNPGLRSESATAIEAGVAKRASSSSGTFSWTLEVVGFARNTDDLIRFRPASQGTAIAENVAEVEVSGIETAAGLRWRSGLSIDGGVTLQHATDVSDGFTHGQPLPYQPELLGFAGLSWRSGAFDARWDVTYTGENSTDTLDTPEARLPERWIHDLAAGVQLARGWEVGLDIRNLFDRKTRDVARYPLPDRVVLVHLGWHDRGER